MSSHFTFRSVFLVAACVTLSACGGGGGASPPPNDVSMTESPSSLSVTALQSDPAPTAQFTLYFAMTGSGSTPITPTDQITHNGITGISAGSGSAGTNTDTIVVQFKSPASLQPGTYTDTVTIKACYEIPCVYQVTGSPVTVTTTYTVVGITPTLSAIAPTSTAAGVPGFTLTVTGSNFTPQALVLWNGQSLPTTVVSSTELTAAVPATDVASAATVPVTVVDGSGDTPSAPLDFTIEPPAALSLATVAPATFAAGSTGAMLEVTGTGFNTTSVVQWNGVALATTMVSTTVLGAQVPAADLAAAGTAAVTVSNAAAPAGVTNALSVAIVDQSLDAVAFQITPTHSGSMQFKSASLPAASKWRVSLDGTPSYPLIAEGKVFLTVAVSAGTELIALDQATGAPVWGPVMIGAPGNAAYDAGRVFVLSNIFASAAILQAFDAATGMPLWSTSLTGQWAFNAAPTAANGIIYVGGSGSGGTLYAVDEQTGALRWTMPVANGNNSSPAVTTGGVYVTYPCQTYDFDPVSGVQLWNNNGGCEGGGGATPVVANGVLYSPNDTSGYAGITLDASNGTVLGSFQADTIPAIGATTGYFLQSGILRAVSLASNTILWSFAGDGSLTGAPIVVNGYVFISSSAGNLYALDSATGQQIWLVNLGAPVDSGSGFDYGIPFSGLGAGQGLLVVPAGNTVTAYTLSTAP